MDLSQRSMKKATRGFPVRETEGTATVDTGIARMPVVSYWQFGCTT